MQIWILEKQHEWSWKTFHWWKAQGRKKNFFVQKRQLQQMHKGIFFSYVCMLVKLQKKLLKYPLILKTKFDLIFIPSIFLFRVSFKKNDCQFLVWGIGDFWRFWMISNWSKMCMRDPFIIWIFITYLDALSTNKKLVVQMRHDTLTGL